MNFPPERARTVLVDAGAAGFDLPRVAAAAGAAAMAATSTGDALLLGVLLGVSAANLAIGAIGVAVGLAVLAGWGSSSLGALAGAQAVIGAAGGTASALGVSMWCGALAMVLAAPPGVLGSLAFGLVAADLVGGPAIVDGAHPGRALVLRVVVSAAAVAAAWLCARRVPRVVALSAAGVAAAVALVVAIAT